MATGSAWAPEHTEQSTEAVTWGSRTAHGRHHPLLGQRKWGATPALLKHRRDLLAIYVKKRLPPSFRETVMIAAAGADSSRQCSFAHREWARTVGVSEKDLAAVENLRTDELDERTWAALAWAQAYARSDFREVPADVVAEFRRWFTPQERADIALAARTMYWLNETSNSVDAALARLRGAPEPGSTVFSEIVAVLIYALTVPPLVVWLGIRRRHKIIDMVLSIGPFFEEFEARGPDTISGPGLNYRGVPAPV